MRNIKIFFACWVTVGALAIIISLLLVILGMEKWMGMFFYLHFTIGAVVVFILFWPFYSKRLK
jgi:hypothetical protein